MQIETIISSISTESAARLEAGAGQGIEFSPIVDNRLVETYVRVADGTPFIIGGLLSTEQQYALKLACLSYRYSPAGPVGFARARRDGTARGHCSHYPAYRSA